MTSKNAQQADALRDLTVAELREQYAEVFGEATRSPNKDFLRKRIIWRLQASAEGGLSDRARRRAGELAHGSDLRLVAPAGGAVSDHRPRSRDRRLPMTGANLTRVYRGHLVTVTILDHGFAYEGAVYRSLTAVAQAVTGQHWGGFHFFGIAGNGGNR